MRAIKIQIHNYRSIISAEYTLRDYSLLVGSNNSGKSTVVNAVRAFYEKDNYKYDKSKDYPFQLNDTERESWVEITYELTADEYQNLKRDYQLPSRQLSVRRIFESFTHKTHDNKPSAGMLFGRKNDGSLSNEPFYGAKGVQNGKLGDLVFIPAISKVDEYTKTTGPSALRDLLIGILKEVEDYETSFSELEANFKNFSKKLEESSTQDGRSLAGARDSLNGDLDGWGVGLSFEWKSPDINAIIKGMVETKYRDLFHDKEVSIEECGSGFQRQLIYALIKTGAAFANSRPKPKKVDFSPDMQWIIFEEPEAFLHPPQQNELARNLRKLSTLEDVQILATSHSSNFVSKDLDEIVGLARIEKDKGTSRLYQISSERWSEIASDNAKIAGVLGINVGELKEFQKAEALRYSIFLSPYRASLFFSSTVLLVEGTTEQALIDKLLDEAKISAPQGFLVIDTLGKYNTHRFMNLLGELGIKHAVLVDKDNSIMHEKINRLIESSRNNFTLGIDFLENDMESYLRVEKVNQDYQKPLTMMSRYNNGGIDSTRINDLASRIEAIIK